ncbi:MAG: DUF4981 domain-containing protein [Treponema sp.]|nr:DUF4981 domain-containing protein [Treponema sp.]
MLKIHQKPEIQEINRLPMRSPLIPFSSEKKAVEECAAGPENISFTKSEFAKSLDGKWKFLLQQSADADENSLYRDWTQKNFNDSNWRQIEVPGTWTLQDTGDYPHYTNVQMPWTSMPPFVPKKNPTGLYRLAVDIPSAWKERRIVLHIGSAESVAEIYVNGKFCGASKDTRLPCEFDISDFLEWKGSSCKALLCIKVIRYSDASFVEDQDQWWFGGIHRSVYLYSTESIYIKDVKALTQIDKSAKSAQGLIPLRIEVALSQPKKFDDEILDLAELSQIKIGAKYSVYEMRGTPSKANAGKKVAEGFALSSLDYRETLNEIRADIKIKNPNLWSSESPSLYIVSATLCQVDEKSKAEQEIESVAFTVGFKSVEVKDRKLLLNGKAVYIHGVNRHEHSETNGKTLLTSEMLRDIKTLKSYNFNAVRTCHYPDDERWYELCDRYGIYILDEANIENHCYYDAMSRDDSWAYAYAARVQRMFRRDKNHACIIGWSLGNESGNGQNHVANAAWLRAVDKTRLVHYEGFVRPIFHQGGFDLDALSNGKGLTDLISPMYPEIDLIVQYAKEREDYRPIIMCEYSHAMGNANGSLADYWKAIENTPGLQGGFIWDWIDQGIAATLPAGKNGNPQGGKYWKYGGDFGDKPSDYDFCLNGINFPDQTPKPAMEECRYLFAPVRLNAIHAEQGIFEIENRRDFSDLNDLEMKCGFLSNGREIKSAVIKMPKILPGQKTEIQITSLPQFAAAAKNDQDISLRVQFVYSKDTPFAKKGDLVRQELFAIKRADDLQDFAAASNDKHKETFAAEEELKGLVKEIKPQLWRAMIENEGVKRELCHLNDGTNPWCFFQKPTRSWLNSGLDRMQVNEIGKNKFELLSPNDALEKKSFGTYSIQTKSALSPDKKSALQLSITFNLKKSLAEYPRVGITLPISADFSDVSWYGNGPHESYSDRNASAILALHSKKIAEMETPYIVPQENGSRDNCFYLEFMSGKKRLHVQSKKPFTFSVLKYSAEDLFKKEHMSELIDLTKLEKNPHWLLNIDAAMRGVGTGACGPDTLERYRIRPGVYKLDLLIW